ncbi:MAG TPA: Slp family lipoprotein [Anaerolineae bacterium]|nr:Slp family lipoprotein [Anaerolineae bacterium]
MQRSLALILWFGLILLTSCATLPPELQGQTSPLTLSQVMHHPEAYQGKTVRWGGTILKLENAADQTRIQILARPLDRSGRPRADANPLGRFLAHTSAFLDPAIYAPGRELTVVGKLAGTTEVTVGQRKIRIPTVEAERWHLWPRRERKSPVVVYPYWWYGFGWWYYPWGPCCW